MSSPSSRKEIATKKEGYVGNQWGVPQGNTPKTLSDIGISRKESGTFQEGASVLTINSYKLEAWWVSQSCFVE